MNTAEQLVKTRNFLRTLIMMLDDPIDIECRSTEGFFGWFTKNGVDVGILEESNGTFRITPPETYEPKPRHKGANYK